MSLNNKMKTLLNKILLTGMIIGSCLKPLKGQENDYCPDTFLDDEFLCDSWVSDTSTYKANEDVFVPSIMSQFNVKRLLKEKSDSAVANLRHNRNFYHWLYKNGSIFNFSGCHLGTLGLYRPLDNFNVLCNIINDKGRPFLKEEFFGTIISLLSKQQHGEKGVLSVEYSNVFFVRLDPKCTVSANIWYNSAWNVKAWEIQAYTMRSWGPKDKIFFAK